MVDAYIVSNLQESLGLTDEQFVRLLPLVKRLQSERRGRHAAARPRGARVAAAPRIRDARPRPQVAEQLREVKRERDRGAGEGPQDDRGDRRRAHPPSAGQVPRARVGRRAADPRDHRSGAPAGDGRSPGQQAAHARRAVAPSAAGTGRSVGRGGFSPLPHPGGSPILRGHGQKEGGQGFCAGARPEAAYAGDGQRQGQDGRLEGDGQERRPNGGRQGLCSAHGTCGVACSSKALGWQDEPTATRGACEARRSLGHDRWTGRTKGEVAIRFRAPNEHRSARGCVPCQDRPAPAGRRVPEGGPGRPAAGPRGGPERGRRRSASAKYLPRDLPPRLFEEERFLFPETYGIEPRPTAGEGPRVALRVLGREPGGDEGARPRAWVSGRWPLSRLTLRITDPVSGGSSDILLPRGRAVVVRARGLDAALVPGGAGPHPAVGGVPPPRREQHRGDAAGRAPRRSARRRRMSYAQARRAAGRRRRGGEPGGRARGTPPRPGPWSAPSIDGTAADAAPSGQAARGARPKGGASDAFRPAGGASDVHRR